jgi:uncharacterized membrane protein YphA (DoxX/SURF4 family)
MKQEPGRAPPLRRFPPSLVLFLFLIPTTIIFHLAHIHDPEQGQMQMIQVMKNLAIMGGLLKFYLTGAGACALDSVLARRRQVAAHQPAP